MQTAGGPFSPKSAGEHGRDKSQGRLQMRASAERELPRPHQVPAMSPGAPAANWTLSLVPPTMAQSRPSRGGAGGEEAMMGCGGLTAALGTEKLLLATVQCLNV